ncbi:MAG TPA: proline racemase family protein [Candidatus Tyrphobacter sp.]
MRPIETVESHTQGMPTRVVIGGIDPIPGSTMFERRAYALAHLEPLRQLLMFEPRGHAAMSGAIVMPPADPNADLGVLFIESTGFLPMCGHGAIGVCTVAIETGMVRVTEPQTTLVLDTPAGLVRASIDVSAGRAKSVTLTNVPSFLALRDANVEVEGVGTLRFDLAYGGNFYAILPAHEAGLTLALEEAPRVVERGMRVMRAISEQHTFAHPLERRIAELRHVLFTAPPSRQGAGAKGAIVLYPGTLDRSPCGTGTSARMAQRYFRGEQALHEPFAHESVLGSLFFGCLIEEREIAAGIRAVVPTIRGRAWISGYAKYVLDPEDSFPNGFLIPTA